MRKFLVLGILIVFLTTGLGFGQQIPAQQEQQDEGQPVVFQLFGTTWIPITGKSLGTFSDLGVSIILIWARDMNGIGGIIEILLIANQDLTKTEVLGGWIKAYTPDEQGFYLKENSKELNLLGKKDETYEKLEWRGYDDQNGNPILEFYLIKKDGSKEVVRTIDIRKFVEENFQNPEK